MHILARLEHLWKDELFTKKILLIHTGGQCRRLPQHSAVGKLFARLPRGRMLDIKLAIYLPFCKKMSSGVFLTASDDIETFSIGKSTKSLNNLVYSFTFISGELSSRFHRSLHHRFLRFQMGPS